MRTKPMRITSKFQISHLFGDSYGRAAIVGTAINDFTREMTFYLPL